MGLGEHPTYPRGAVVPAGRLSRYEFSRIHFDDEGRSFFDVPAPIPAVTLPDDERPVVGEGDSIFTLAWFAYMAVLDSDPAQDIRPTEFFWVVALANDILDAAAPLEVGDRLRVHSVDALFTRILVPPPHFSLGEETV